MNGYAYTVKSAILALTLILTIINGVSEAKAADLNVTCTNPTTCTITPANQPLFNETNWVPGQSSTKTFEISNQTGQSCDFKMHASQNQSNPQFNQNLFTAIRKGPSTVVYGMLTSGKAQPNKNLEDVFADEVLLGNVSAAQNITYHWTLTLNPNANNELQGKTTNFNFNLGFECLPSGESSNGSGGTTTQSNGSDDNGDNDNDENGDEDEDDNGDDDDENDQETSSQQAIGGAATTSAFFAFQSTSTSSAETGGTLGAESGTELEDDEETTTIVDGLDDDFGDVAGVSAEQCIDTQWWWLIFVLQILLHQGVILLMSETAIKSNTKYFYTGQILLGTAFSYVAWQYLCPWWAVWVAIGITILMTGLTYRKANQ